MGTSGASGAVAPLAMAGEEGREEGREEKCPLKMQNMDFFEINERG